MMRKFIQAMLFGLALCVVSTFATTRSTVSHPNVVMIAAQPDETQEQAHAALDELDKFAAAHSLLGAYRDGSEAETFDVALFITDDDGQATGDPKWIVYGFSTLTEAVKQIEADYATYPDGHETTESNDSKV
jgi:hypothetical protein